MDANLCKRVNLDTIEKMKEDKNYCEQCNPKSFQVYGVCGSCDNPRISLTVGKILGLINENDVFRRIRIKEVK